MSFSMRMTEEEVLESVEYVKDAEGIVLSWNLLYIPKEYFKAVRLFQN